MSRSAECLLLRDEAFYSAFVLSVIKTQHLSDMKALKASESLNETDPWRLNNLAGRISQRIKTAPFEILDNETTRGRASKLLQ